MNIGFGPIGLDIFVAVIGALLHISMKWEEYRRTVSPVGIFGYFAHVPAQTSVSVLSAVGAFTVCSAVGWMNPGLAFACGYMGNSIAENLANRFAKVP